MARGLLENDHEWRICLEEAIAIQPGMACHWLLAVILLTDEVAEPHVLWDQFKAGLLTKFILFPFVITPSPFLAFQMTFSEHPLHSCYSFFSCLIMFQDERHIQKYLKHVYS